jgi:RNA polymerase sigma-70 factor (ECF subfamily)
MFVWREDLSVEEIPPDAELLRRTAAGEPDAFGSFYRRHESAVLLYFLRRTQSPELAADLTAETFAAALASIRRFRSERGPAIGWLFGIAGHKLADSCRRGQVEDRARRRLRLEPLVLTDDDLERVEALADAAAESEALTRALAELPAAQRDAIEQRVIAERPYGEVASELRCSEAVVRKRVARGLASMRVALKEESR